MAPHSSYAQLVSLACHDLRTPLATVSGFAHTLRRLDTIEPPADRYVEMIGAAAEQLTELLDLLAAVTRVESGRFEPQLHAVDSLELAHGAVALLEPGQASVSGVGDEIDADRTWTERAIAALATCVRRHGGLDHVELTVRGAEIELAPLSDGVGAIATGEDLRDFSAAVASRLIGALGGSVAVVDRSLRIALRK